MNIVSETNFSNLRWTAPSQKGLKHSLDDFLNHVVRGALLSLDDPNPVLSSMGPFIFGVFLAISPYSGMDSWLLTPADAKIGRQIRPRP
jgi:hypothetical protein